MNDIIKSKFLSIPINTDIKGLLYISKQKIKGKDITFITLNIDTKNSISLGGNIARKTDTDLSLRIKLEDEKGLMRMYDLYNTDTKQTTKVNVDYVLTELTKKGFEEKEFNPLDLISNK